MCCCFVDATLPMLFHNDILLNDAHFIPLSTLYSNKYKFSHAELVTKKEKLAALHAKRTKDSKLRQLSLSASKEAVRKRRELSAKNKAANQHHSRHSSVSKLSVEQMKQKLESKLEMEGAEEFMGMLPGLIHSCVEGLREENEGVEMECERLKRVIGGYQRALGESVGGVEMDGTEEGVAGQ